MDGKKFHEKKFWLRMGFARQEKGVLGGVTKEEEEKSGCGPFILDTGPGLMGLLPLPSFGDWGWLFHNCARSL